MQIIHAGAVYKTTRSVKHRTSRGLANSVQAALNRWCNDCPFLLKLGYFIRCCLMCYRRCDVLVVLVEYGTVTSHCGPYITSGGPSRARRPPMSELCQLTVASVG